MKKALIVIAALILIYLMGPTPDKPEYSSDLPNIPSMAGALETYVANIEQKHKLKPGNNAEIVWATDEKSKTEYSVVYLHGFSASQMEGYPIHRRFADYFGCNLYLARLSDHGIDTTDALYDFTPERLWRTAKEAYAIGKQLGDKVIIMSTSTGGTLAVLLGANYPDVAALINFSPNIEINDPAAFMLNDPWGLQIARLVFGGKTRTVESDSIYEKYWYDTYRLEAIVQLQELVETACTEENFEKITCPVFNGVYYKDEEHQDPVVRVSAIRQMHQELGTPDSSKVFKEFPYANTHVIASDIKSGSVDEVFDAVKSFGIEKLKMQTRLEKMREMNSKRDEMMADTVKNS
jgi:esterase/lipase